MGHRNRHGATWQSTRARSVQRSQMRVAAFSLSFLLLAASVHAQAPPLSPPAPREAPRPGTAQDFISWLRHLVPTQSRQSRAVASIPLPRPRPPELTPTPIEPSNAPAELAPTSVEPTEAPAELTPAPDESKEETAPAPLNDLSPQMDERYGARTILRCRDQRYPAVGSSQDSSRLNPGRTGPRV